MNKYILKVNVTGNLFFVILVITDSNGCELQKKKTNKVLYRHSMPADGHQKAPQLPENLE
jgi:hypothetical protein